MGNGTMLESEKNYQVSDAEVAEAAKALLVRAPSHSMTMASLGQLLSRTFEKPLRSVLGRRKLLPVLREQFGNTIQITGDSGSEIATLVEGEGASHVGTRIQFDPAIWAAFAKPIAEPKRRHISLRRPFDFDDIADGAPIPPGTVEVPKTRIPDEKLERPERDALIVSNITAWCEEHNLSPHDCAAAPKQRSHSHRTLVGLAVDHGPNTSKGLVALKILVEAIPQQEQAQFSLPLNLIGKLLS
jgi:hypothetical protein